jgi:hypothetical protein
MVGPFILAAVVMILAIAAVVVVWPLRGRQVGPHTGTPVDHLAKLREQWIAGEIREQQAWEEMWLYLP